MSHEEKMEDAVVMQTMNEAEARVWSELKELQERTFKLQRFITDNEKYSNLSDTSRGLIQAQLSVMQAYQHILKMRMDNWQD